MNSLLEQFIEPDDTQRIQSVHQLQEDLYGVYLPPSLKQLKSLRYLLVSTGSLDEVDAEKLLGLSKIECQVILNKLNSIYISQRRNYDLSGVKKVGNIGR